MNWIEYHDDAKMQSHVHITISDYERVRIKLTPLDRALLDDIGNSENVTFADRLLGLEMIARRIEESP